METLPIQIKQHPLVKNNKIKEYEIYWGVVPRYLDYTGLATYTRERYMYLTVELESGEILRFEKDTFTNNVYLM